MNAGIEGHIFSALLAYRLHIPLRQRFQALARAAPGLSVACVEQTPSTF